MPREFSSEDFSGVDKVEVIIGDNDEYINKELIAQEQEHLNKVFKDKVSFTIFDGTHKLKPEVIKEI
jgi:surfactin synthase thioesterase subunit